MLPVLPVLVLTLISVTQADPSLTIDQIVILVLDQDNPYHSTRSLEFITKVEEQSQSLNGEPDIRLLSQHYRQTGAWTLFPILADLYDSLETKHKYVFICEEETRLDLRGFLTVLNKFNSNEELFLGFGLVDQQSTIIHHYAFHTDVSKFKYPHPTAGFVLSRSLLKTVKNAWLDGTERKMQFTIDVYHEFAKFLYDMKNHSVLLTHVPEFCTRKSSACVTWQSSDFPNCGKPVPIDDIFFAVKTCQKFHSKRIPVIKKVWTKDAKHIEFFSDQHDPSIPTIDLGIPNAERGHCQKTVSILRRAVNEAHIRSKPWFVLVDDDTILNVSRLQRLLACYNHEDTVALGERYGYGVTNSRGYDYITLGGGMALTHTTVLELVESKFSCSKDDPDDMMLGMVLQNLQIPIIHSPHFHQARPRDYSLDYLNSHKAVSFHRFDDGNDAQTIYREYLTDVIQHEEL